MHVNFSPEFKNLLNDDALIFFYQIAFLKTKFVRTSFDNCMQVKNACFNQVFN